MSDSNEDPDAELHRQAAWEKKKIDKGKQIVVYESTDDEQEDGSCTSKQEMVKKMVLASPEKIRSFVERLRKHHAETERLSDLRARGIRIGKELSQVLVNFVLHGGLISADTTEAYVGFGKLIGEEDGWVGKVFKQALGVGIVEALKQWKDARLTSTQVVKFLKRIREPIRALGEALGTLDKDALGTLDKQGDDALFSADNEFKLFGTQFADFLERIREPIRAMEKAVGIVDMDDSRAIEQHVRSLLFSAEQELDLLKLKDVRLKQSLNYENLELDMAALWGQFEAMPNQSEELVEILQRIGDATRTPRIGRLTDILLLHEVGPLYENLSFQIDPNSCEEIQALLEKIDRLGSEISYFGRSKFKRMIHDLWGALGKTKKLKLSAPSTSEIGIVEPQVSASTSDQSGDSGVRVSVMHYIHMIDDSHPLWHHLNELKEMGYIVGFALSRELLRFMFMMAEWFVPDKLSALSGHLQKHIDEQGNNSIVCKRVHDLLTEAEAELTQAADDRKRSWNLQKPIEEVYPLISKELDNIIAKFTDEMLKLDFLLCHPTLSETLQVDDFFPGICVQFHLRLKSITDVLSLLRKKIDKFSSTSNCFDSSKVKPMIHDLWGITDQDPEPKEIGKRARISVMHYIHKIDDSSPLWHPLNEFKDVGFEVGSALSLELLRIMFMMADWFVPDKLEALCGRLAKRIAEEGYSFVWNPVAEEENSVVCNRVYFLLREANEELTAVADDRKRRTNGKKSIEAYAIISNALDKIIAKFTDEILKLESLLCHPTLPEIIHDHELSGLCVRLHSSLKCNAVELSLLRKKIDKFSYTNKEFDSSKVKPMVHELWGTADHHHPEPKQSKIVKFWYGVLALCDVPDEAVCNCKGNWKQTRAYEELFRRTWSDDEESIGSDESDDACCCF